MKKTIIIAVFAVVALFSLLIANYYVGYYFYQRGVAHFRASDQAAAMVEFNRCVRYSPFFDLGYHARALLRSDMGDFSGAIEDLNEAIELNPENAEFVVHRADIYRREGLNFMAEIDYTTALGLKSATPSILIHAHLWRGGCRNVLESYTGALQDFDEVLKRDPANIEALLNRGYTKNRLWKLEDAARDFDSASSLDPKDLRPLQGRGMVRENQGDFQAAVADLEMALSLKPDSALTLAFLGRVKHTLGREEEAVADLGKAVSMAPKSDQVLIQRARLRILRREWQKALDDYRAAFAMERDQNHFDRAMMWLALNRLGDPASAQTELEEHLIECVGQDSDWEQAMMTFLLGWITEDELFSRAYSPERRIQNVRVTGAWFLAGLKKRVAGDHAGAAAYLLKCVETAQMDNDRAPFAESELRELRATP